ncbi:MAG TPA: hypothetical protein VNB64_00885 [Solirubrobacteraceae bacterium]|nr:hypothetical protein [Solirubrobacteraceae bacterium]
MAATGWPRAPRADATGHAAINRVFVVAGNSFRPHTRGDGGPATEAGFEHPVAVAALASGGVLIVDAASRRVRLVDPQGFISTLAGTGARGSTGDGGPARRALLERPQDAIATPDGAILIADAAAHRVRRIDPDGTISTFAGTGQPGFSVDGTPATAARLTSPRQLARAPTGEILVIEGGRVRAVEPSGTLRTVAGGGGMAPAEGLHALNAKLSPAAVTTLPGGDLGLSDPPSHRVWRVRDDGTLAVLAGRGEDTDDNTVPFGNGGPARDALVSSPDALLALPDGDLLVADGGELRRVTADGTILHVAGAHGLSAWSPFAEPIHRAPFASYYDMSQTADGVLIADARNNRIRFWARAEPTSRLLIAPTGPMMLGEPTRRLAAGFLLSRNARVDVEARLAGGGVVSLRRHGTPGGNKLAIRIPGKAPVCRLRVAARSADGQVATLLRTAFPDRPQWGSGGGPPYQPLPLPAPAYLNYAVESGAHHAEIWIAPDGNATLADASKNPLRPTLHFTRLEPGELRRLRHAVSGLSAYDIDANPDMRTRDGDDHRVSLRDGGFAALTPELYSMVVPGAHCLGVREFPFATRRQWRLVHQLEGLVDRKLGAARNRPGRR